MEPSTLSFYRGKLREVGRSPSPPHPHPVLVPPSQTKCEPGWPRTPKKLPLVWQSQHLWAGQRASAAAQPGKDHRRPALRSQLPEGSGWGHGQDCSGPCSREHIPFHLTTLYPPHPCWVSWLSLHSTLYQVHPSVLQSCLGPPAWMDALRLPRRPGVLLPKLVLLFVYTGQ